MTEKMKVVDEIEEVMNRHDLDICDRYEALSIGALACLNLMYEELEVNDDRFKGQFMKDEWDWSLEDFLEYDKRISSLKVDREGENG